jgi:hypothetical protein
VERDGGRSETDLAQSASLRRADGPSKPLWHIKKKAPRGTCFRVCTVQVAERESAATLSETFLQITHSLMIQKPYMDFLSAMFP